MPTRTKNAEMSKIVSNSEIHLHHCLCESSGFKIGKSNHRRCSVSVLGNFAKLTEKNLCPSPTLVFYWQFYEIFENAFFTEHFRATASDEEAWWSKYLIPSSFSWRKYLLRSLAYLILNHVEKKSCVTVGVGHLGYVTCKFSTRGEIHYGLNSTLPMVNKGAEAT